MKYRKKNGMSRLTWAWIGLVTVAGGTLLAVRLFGAHLSQPEETIITLEGEPETYARALPGQDNIAPPDIMAQTAIAVQPVFSTTDEETPLPQVQRAPATPAPTPPPTRTIDTPEDAVALEGDSATVIKLADLPDSSTARTVQIAKPVMAAPKGAAPPAPDPALSIAGQNGPYPTIAADGRTSARYYRRTFDDPEQRPRISLIVAGLGLSTGLTSQAINDLPPEVTLAFAPYAKDLPQWSRQARAAGHELMLEIPMEAAGVAVDALGPAALLTSRTDAENRQRLDWSLSRFQGYFGVTNYLGGSFTADRTAIAPVFTTLSQAGLAMIGDNEADVSTLSASGLPRAQTDFLFSAIENTAEIDFQIIESKAQETGNALVKIYATPQSLAQISLWAKTLQERGIVLAPASTMLQ
ncbi:MAG: divergent polysaccharide deacetylase family protein [Aquisalinus sp.]|nr:divergent polysaccharide deacetylase family protein [Aquisalinus sp.]